jgi:alpha-mannosidase
VRKVILVTIALLLGSCVWVGAQTNPQAGGQKKRNLNVVATAHLDTQWRWTIQNTINEYVPATFRNNFKLMQQYPDYVFSFEGAFKYMLLKEYYPDEYRKLKPFIDNGQWRLAGGWVDPVDVNMPSFESLVRHTLYGNGYFQQEFGKMSRDVLLPDCFGFGYALPSIAAHCGLVSFSTQKLTWGSAVGVPFDIGIWEGVDGSTLAAALNPGSYGTEIRGDLSRDTAWTRKIDKQGDSTGLYAAYMYFGTGDTGGSPDSLSVDWLEKSIKSDGPITVKSIGSDDLAGIIKANKDAHLNRYKGELVMTRHGSGCYTSEAAMKRWNRKNEQLADATERASVIAQTLGVLTYPKEDLKQTWIRFLWHQFHDDLTGTSIPEAYQFSWNDEILTQNRFASLLENAIEATTPTLDTRVKGVPLVVYNPLAIVREDVVEATVVFGGGTAVKAIRVFGADGKEVPSQIVQNYGDSLKVAFVAKVPSVGYAVFDVRPDKMPCNINSGLKATTRELENQRYIVKLDDWGNVFSITDKIEKRELLTAPISFQLLHDKPKQWPAWEVQYEDVIAAPVLTVGGEASIHVIENGPARVAIQVVRPAGRSVFCTVIRLAAGSDRIEFDNDIDWYERETLLKAAFPLATANENVTYDIGLGTIERGINTPKKYEVPAHQWADMTAPTGDYGVAILNDCKYGWDHPDAGTLRLSLIHTPGIYENWQWVSDERSQDNGHHKFVFAVQGHHNDWRGGDVIWQAARLNQPLLAFQVPTHAGKFGKQYSLLSVTSGGREGKSSSSESAPRIMLNAIKMAEGSKDEVVVRLRELNGKQEQNVQVRFAKPIISAREVNGAEEPMGDAQVTNGTLVTSLKPYQPRAFAVKFTETIDKPSSVPLCAPLLLTFNTDGISSDDDRRDGALDDLGNTLSGDLLPDTLHWRGTVFVLGSKKPGAANVVSCTGKLIPLQSGSYDYLDLLVAAVGGPAEGTFAFGDTKTTVRVQDYTARLGQWNSRLTNSIFQDEPNEIAPTYINRAPVAWVGTHRHSGKGENEAYQFTYLYLVRLNVPKGATTVALPNNPRIKVFAATLVKSSYDNIHVAQPLYDVANTTVTSIAAARTAFVDKATATISCPVPGAEIVYTIDGSEPTKSSPKYEQPITMTESTTLKSRALLVGSDDHFVNTLNFSRLIPKDPVVVAKTAGGIPCRYYEGEWRKLPGFDSLKFTRELMMDTIGIPNTARKEDYGLVFTGYVRIPQEGLYDFSISSDDGSVLMVADSLLIENDGIHGSGEVPGSIALKAGLHPIKVRMFQSKGGQDLQVFIAGPGMEKQLLPSSMLCHEVKGKRR